jgi:hypothetical protein
MSKNTENPSRSQFFEFQYFDFWLFHHTYGMLAIDVVLQLYVSYLFTLQCPGSKRYKYNCATCTIAVKWVRAIIFELLDWLPLRRNMHKYQSRSAVSWFARIYKNNNGLTNKPIQGVIGLPWFFYIACRDLWSDKPIAKNNKYFQRRYEFIDYLLAEYLLQHACSIFASPPMYYFIFTAYICRS